MKSISKDFKKLYEQTIDELHEKVRFINCGGCGCYALSLSSSLTKLGYEHEFVVIFRNKSGLSNGKKYIKENNIGEFHNSSAWTHIMLKINSKLIDSSGIYKSLSEKYDEPKYKTIVDKSYLEELVNKKDYWNIIFNRKNIKKINKILEKNLVDSN